MRIGIILSIDVDDLGTSDTENKPLIEEQWKNALWGLTRPQIESIEIVNFLKEEEPYYSAEFRYNQKEAIVYHARYRVPITKISKP